MDTSIEGKRVAVSGSGNVAQFAVEKLLQLGAVPVTMSDSSGTLYEPNGFTIEQLSQIMTIKRNKGRLSEFQLSPAGELPSQSCMKSNSGLLQTVSMPRLKIAAIEWNLNCACMQESTCQARSRGRWWSRRTLRYPVPHRMR